MGPVTDTRREEQRRPISVGARSFVKKLLTIDPSADTTMVRRTIASAFDPALPFCAPPEGELLRELILQHQYRHCLEVGFATGSTALYMLHALGDTGGDLVSIDRPEGPYNAIGKSLLAGAPVELRLAPHRLIEEDSAQAIPQLLREGQTFDLIFVDGWKTFDHLAAEAYYLTRMLRVGGVMVFDDAAMPSVHKVIRLLQTHYQHQEVEYRRYGHTLRHRAFEVFTSRSRLRPYRAFTKVRSEADLPVTQDWNFFERF